MPSPDHKQSLHHIRLSIPLLVVRIVLLFVLVELVASLLPAALTTVGLLTVGSVAALSAVRAIIELIVVLKVVLDWATVVYYIRDHQLVKFRGIFELRENTWELRSLKTTKLRQTWLGNLLGYGDLAVVFSSSGYREDIVLRGIARARECEHVFRAYLAEASEKKRSIDEEVPAVPTEL